MIHIRRKDLYTHLVAVPYVQRRLRRITHDTGQQCRHILYRIVLFQISCLIADDRISRRVRFVESILGKAHHLVEYLIRRLGRYPIPYAARYLDISGFIRLSVQEDLALSDHLLHLLFGHCLSELV